MQRIVYLTQFWQSWSQSSLQKVCVISVISIVFAFVRGAGLLRFSKLILLELRDVRDAIGSSKFLMTFRPVPRSQNGILYHLLHLGYGWCVATTIGNLLR
jgi:hypothetical protein